MVVAEVDILFLTCKQKCTGVRLGVREGYRMERKMDVRNKKQILEIANILVAEIVAYKYNIYYTI